MKKKLTLIFCLLLVLAGCKESASSIAKRTLDGINNYMSSLWGSEAISNLISNKVPLYSQSIKQPGFGTHYLTIVYGNSLTVKGDASYEDKAFSSYVAFSAENSEVKDYVANHPNNACKISDDNSKANCRTKITASGNSYELTSTGDSYIDSLLSDTPLLLNSLTFDYEYLKGLTPTSGETYSSLAIFSELDNDEGTHNSVEYNNVDVSSDPNATFLANYSSESTINLEFQYNTHREKKYNHYYIEYGPVSYNVIKVLLI